MVRENVLDTRTVNDVEVVLTKGVIPALHHRAEVFLSAHKREWFVIGVQCETITIKEMIESFESKDHCQELSLNSRIIALRRRKCTCLKLNVSRRLGLRIDLVQHCTNANRRCIRSNTEWK